MAPQYDQLQWIIQCLLTNNDGSTQHWHGPPKTLLWNKLHSPNQKRRVCHISLTSYRAEQVSWSHTFSIPFCFNVKDFHHSTQVINHVLSQAAPGGKIRIQPHTFTSTEPYVYTQKHKQQFKTAGELYILSPTPNFPRMQTHICEATFINQWSQMGLNKNSDKASSFCRKLKTADHTHKEAPEPKIITEAWCCLITF